MTRTTFASLAVAASFLLPAAALAQSPGTESVCAEASYLLETQTPTMPGVAEAVAICDDLFAMRSLVDEMTAERDAAAAELKELDVKDFELRVDMFAAKAAYAADPSSENFYALIAIQKGFNHVSSQRVEVALDIAEIDAELAAMWPALEAAEAALIATIP